MNNLENAKKIFENFLKANKKYHYMINISQSIDNLQKHFEFENTLKNRVEFVKIFENVFGYTAIGKNTKNSIFWNI